MESVPVGINKCPVHNCWIKKYVPSSRDPDRHKKTFRYCPRCHAEEMAKKKATLVEQHGEVPNVRIMTL